MPANTKTGRKKWVVARIVANVDERRKAKFDRLLAHYQTKEARTTMTNVVEAAIDRLYLTEFGADTV